MTLPVGVDALMSEAEIDARESFCRELVRGAGSIAMNGFTRRKSKDIGFKGPQDFLTETDAAVEAHIRQRIAKAFSEDGFIGEESGGEAAQYVWVVDPIDGTANFARDIPHFCVSIAFVANGRTELGAIFNPALDELYFARRGRGAERNGEKLQVCDTDGFGGACVEMGWSGRHEKSAYLNIVSAILDLGANIRRGASGALGLAYVADGRSDAYLELHMQPWDCMAGLLLVEEAGGTVCPFLENGGMHNGGPVLASVPAIAGQLSAASGIDLTPGDGGAAVERPMAQAVLAKLGK